MNGDRSPLGRRVSRDGVPRDHLPNRIRNLLLFKMRYPWVSHGRNVHVKWSTHFWSPHRRVVLGDHVGIGRHCLIQADVTIGNYVLIASYVAFVGSDDHRIDKPGVPIWASGRGDSRQIVIEDDVWIGHGAVILTGARIGRGSVIGAGALVTGDVPPYSIVVGERGRVLRKRFTDEEIAVHERMLGVSGE